MINNTKDDQLLDSTVVKAMATAIHNPFDKKICGNCKLCSAKGEIKFYCGDSRSAVHAEGGCDKFKPKTITSDKL